MTSMLEPILGQVDPTVLWVFIGIMAVCVVLSIIKKAIKIAVTVALIASLATVIAPLAQEFQENYKFEIVDSTAILKIKGEEFRLSRDECKDIRLENKGSKGYSLIVDTKNGKLDIIIPTFMMTSMRDFADKYGIPVSVLE